MYEVLKKYCSNLENRLSGVNQEEEGIARVKEEIAPLLEDPTFLVETLTELVEGEANLLATDNNDITIYRSSQGLFSVRLFVWQSFVPYPVHDHGSWGLLGCLAGQVQQTKYRRLDDGGEEHYAHLEQTQQMVLKPGDTDKMYPLDRGIHHMEALGDRTALTLHTYGPPKRKGYIRGFVPHRKTTYRIFPPKYGPRVVGLYALSALPARSTERVFGSIEKEGHPLLQEITRLIKSDRLKEKRDDEIGRS